MSSFPATGSSSSIEFPCTQCGRRLQVTREAIGRQAQCPECQSVQTVPNIEQASTPANVTSSMNVTPPARPQSDGISFDDQAAPTPASSTTTQPQPTSGLSTSSQYGTANSQTRALLPRIRQALRWLRLGRDALGLGTLLALFSGGHALIESVPGLGKTLFVRTLGRVLGCEFGRIQFTADLMPSDITGAPIFNVKTQEFEFRPGPVFTQLLLADEINRSPAKTHAALLETMQEYRVTVDGHSHELARPFLVMATQNPIESEGTYNLPEAQLDRFMFKLVADYPGEREEAEILRMHSQQVDINKRLEEEVETVTSPEDILATAKSSSNVRVDDKLVDYINKVVRLTRSTPQLHMGASPRAGLALMRGARTLAAFAGRDYAVPDDVVEIALPTLRHRVSLTAEAEVEGHLIDDVLTQLIRSVEVPRI